jgi:hypothetical protein
MLRHANRLLVGRAIFVAESLSGHPFDMAAAGSAFNRALCRR